MGRAARLPTPVAKRQECLNGGRGGFLLLGVCVEDVAATALPRQRSELLTTQVEFRWLRHFLLGATSGVEVNESGYAFKTSRKYVHQSIVGQKEP